MESNKNLTKLYSSTKEELKSLLENDSRKEEKLLNLIKKLTFDKDFIVKEDNTYIISQIEKIFRYYEEVLRTSFQNNKEQFEIEFKLYLLLIKCFTELCNLFLNDSEKKENIQDFFETLKESKNILKFTLPLDMKHINTLNNLIGEQLYYFSHIHYHDINAYPIDYTFEKYYLNLEKMLHGYDLSKSSNFGHKEFTDEKIEFSILKNNASFLILTLLHKFYNNKSKNDFLDNKFQNIIKLYKNNFLDNSSEESLPLKVFEESVLDDFIESTRYIKKIMKCNPLNNKIVILNFNTDEYKQLIDIIKKIDSQD